MLKFNRVYPKKSFEDNKKAIVSPDMVKYIKENKGKIRQVDLAKKAGVTQGHISNIQKGKYHLNIE